LRQVYVNDLAAAKPLHHIGRLYKTTLHARAA
jgi:hypothetical protein